MAQAEATTKTALSLGQHFLDILSTGGGPTALEPLLSESFTWKIFPESLGALPRNKDDYLLIIGNLSNLYKSLKATKVLDTVDAGDSAVLHLHIQLQHGTTDEVFGCEYIFIFRSSPDGKLASVTEFVDAEVTRKSWAAGDGVGFNLLNKE
ncbi:hypothetical protein MIND_00994900 [Mycena indigotica]|uniref:SnoaL-like domain-containing protein n=1 Tax=Mycena indigotica TaxID=2126181 RepID=A0A8H6VUN4_9AGAR|nr:uncharacterized protein MIND_00994900 [Mycena indigotica]KAF7294584.1 hypothetical protein MIND_00994900 [Mycena indigotica]